MIDKLKCHQGRTLLEAVKLLNDNGFGTIFVVDDSDHLVGLLTDGDIRRLLLEDVEFHEKVGEHAKTEFVFAKVDDSTESIIEKSSERIKIIPLVNDQGQLVDFFNLPQKINVPVAIPQLKGNEFKYLMDAFLSTWISSSGSYIRRFEKEVSTFVGTQHGVAVSNGTVAIHLALEALGIGEGDEVIVPDLTFAATINAVLHARATPVIVDVSADNWCICPEAIKSAITERTKAIIPVHIYGLVCDMDAILSIAKEHRLKVIEDCAEAHGAKWNGKPVGSMGDIGTFSFFANKIVTTGEGGMCVTNSDELNDRMMVLRDHGMNKQKRYWHDHVGYNYRMTNLQASIGCAQMEQIDRIIEDKFEIEQAYKTVLKGSDHVTFQDNFCEPMSRSVWLVSILVEEEKRNQILKELKSNGVDGRQFFYPLSDMPIYKKYVSGPTPVSHELSSRGLNLPSSVRPTDKELEAVKKSFSI